MSAESNPVAAFYVENIANKTGLDCYSEPLLQTIYERMNVLGAFLFINTQIQATLVALQAHKDCKIIPLPIFKGFQSFIEHNVAALEATANVHAISVAALDYATRENLNEVAKVHAPAFAQLLAMIEVKNAEKMQLASEKQAAAMGLYKAKNFSAELDAWLEVVKLLEEANPLSVDIISAHMNIANCYREMKQYHHAYQAIERGMTVCKKTTNRSAQLTLEKKLTSINEAQAEISTKKEVDQYIDTFTAYKLEHNIIKRSELINLLKQSPLQSKPPTSDHLVMIWYAVQFNNKDKQIT